MIRIDDTLISLDLLEKKFCCNLKKCKGQCCIDGDSGAPLTAEEVELLPIIIEKVKQYMRPEGIEAIEMQGTHVIDSDNETVTPLIDGKECAYTIFENNIAYCAIEKAWKENKIDFRKPVSCHLYPVRVKSYNDFVAVNYDIWKICEPARILGSKKGVLVYEFLKEALIRRFGRSWYNQLDIAAKEIESLREK